MLSRSRWAALLCLILLAVAADPARADSRDPVDCTSNPADPRCTIEVGTPGAPGEGGSTSTSPCHDPFGRVVPCFIESVGWLADDGCYYQLATGDDLAGAEALGGKLAPPGRWYVGQCGYPPVVGFTKYRAFGAPPGPALLAAEAVKALRLPAPAIQLNPAPPAPQLVGLPMWVWLTANSWGQRSATASVPGLSVTATATPVRLVLATGDGSSVTCTGPGTAWTPGMNPAATSPTCGHTFSSPGTHAVTATVTWNVAWAGGDETGTAGPLNTTATVNTRVAEVGGINTAQAR